MYENEFKVNTCEKCGSLNIEIDISNGKLTCKDCLQSEQKGKKIDMGKVCDDIIDKEKEVIDAFKSLGGQVIIKDKKENDNVVTNKHFYGTEQEL